MTWSSGFNRLIQMLPRAALALGVAAFLPSAALASTAANTTISNTATVNYNDAGGVAQPQVTSLAATVTVTLVPSAPGLVSTTPPANLTLNQGQNATLTYQITSTANGLDTYNLGSSAAPTNDTSVTPTFPATIQLGGSTLAGPAVAGNTTITTPYDGNPSNANDNGLVVGSTIVIGGNTYTITTITKNAGANTTTLGLGGAGITGATVAAGQIIGETKSFTVTVPSGTVTPGTTGTQGVTTTATSGGGTGPGTTGAVVNITVNRPTLTVTKTVSVDGGATFSASGVAPPGTALIYKIVANNTGGSNATSVTFTDVVPQYLTYVNGSGKSATATATTYAAASPLTEGSGGYSFTVGTSTVAYAGGTVAGGGFLVLFFKATIN